MSREALRSVRHFVYRCVDAEGRVVYVGCTHDVTKRWKQHKKTGVAGTTARLKVTVHPDQATALEVERAEIAAHEPRLNRQLYVMGLEDWGQEKILRRLQDELTTHPRLPFKGDANSAITTLRRTYLSKFGRDPLLELSRTGKLPARVRAALERTEAA
ncbi:GIY-YIG nuclease family protein [Brachybacterium halotolerans subsp. kimchii]|uniref:GIY-YIG nuclease family protein n=1 Tax=Brachybacterium halotolerans TaxID=2795215 RepID=UPI001E3BB578|nr:GIY-YIG nuclease family protein [Brachybacterium halotolerans]UEJ83952.1 GIY-YIG nuclease family protein [Brachybacterium halotolerans subsp. kimchii]